jgi:long-chain acyl-CoA synthetase
MSAMAEIKDVAGIVRVHAQESPEGECLVFGERRITWRDLDQRSNQVAQALRAAGVGVQDRVARIDKNGADYFELVFGAAKLNAVTVDVNWRLAPPEMLQIVNDAEAKVLVVGEEFLTHLDKFEAELATVKTIVVVGQHATHQSYEGWLSSAGSTEDPGVTPDADDVCLQLYTSGTTGLPKGVMLTNRNLFSFINEVPAKWGMGPSAISQVVMPLFHIAGSGWALVSLTLGCKVILMREVDPVAILKSIGEDRVTHAIYVPAVLQFLLMVPGVDQMDFTSLELIAYGASPITEKVLTQSMAVFGCKFVQVYGLTETTGAIVQLDAEDHDPSGRPELLRAAGKPYPWIELRIVEPGADGSAEDVPDGEVGEVWVRGVQIMKGYWNKPTETAAAITADGWFRTGDAGYLRDGYLFLHDRVKDMIVTGGENVYPAEVENALMAHPGIADVAVIGVPDEKWGEAVKAIVVKAEGVDVAPDEIIAFARERLGGFKVPKSVDFTEALPRNPSGKILKKDLREPYWAGRERRIG